MILTAYSWQQRSCTALILPRAVDRVVYGTGTVIARQAHARLGHPGPFEACRRCNAFQWAPAEDQGVLVTAADGRLVEDSALVWRLLKP